MSVPASTIAQQLQHISAFARFFTGREIAHLPAVIREGETIRGIVSGFHEGATWLVVVTSERLLFLDKGLIANLRVVDMPLTEIQSISYETGFFTGTLTIRTGGGAKTVEKLWKEGTQMIANVLSQALAETRRYR